MKYKLTLDENNYLLGFEHTGTVEDVYELPIKVINTNHLKCYKLVNNEIIFDEEKYNNIINIEETKKLVFELKEELNNTDYKIIKCSEYQLAGLALPYDVTELHKTRQELRDRINELEN